MQSTTAEKMIEQLDEIFSRYGYPATIKSDNGPQFVSEEFAQYCEQNGIVHVKVTAKWAQANGEVERQNKSILKRLQIAQAEHKPWKRELRKYLMAYRGLPHNTTGRSPAELMFGRKMRGKIPDLSFNPVYDQEVHDRDSEQKAKAKIYADNRRGARYSGVDIGDQVLVQQEKSNKLSTRFNPIPHTVISKNGNSTVVESPSGTQYSRNTSHIKKLVSDDPTPEEKGETPVMPECSDCEEMPQPEPTSVPDASGQTPQARPQRKRNRPKRFDDYVMD